MKPAHPGQAAGAIRDPSCAADANGVRVVDFPEDRIVRHVQAQQPRDELATALFGSPEEMNAALEAQEAADALFAMKLRRADEILSQARAKVLAADRHLAEAAARHALAETLLRWRGRTLAAAGVGLAVAAVLLALLILTWSEIVP